MGGNEVGASFYTINAFADKMKAIFPSGGWVWRVHVSDDFAGWRWDDNTIEAGSGLGWDTAISGLAKSLSVNAPHTFAFSDFDRTFTTDLHTHGIYTRVAGSGGNARHTVFGPNDPVQALPVYIRFDLGIASDTTFNVPAGTIWEVGRIRKSNFGPIVHFELTEDKEIQLHKAGGGTVKSSPISLDTMVSVEVKLTATDAELFINNTSVGNLAGTYTGVKDIRLGIDEDSDINAEGRIYIDAVRVDSVLVGTNVQKPWDRQYLDHWTYDSARRDINSILDLAERDNITLIITVGVPEPPDGFSWQTPQFAADLVEYIYQVADSDFASKTFDFAHPVDNTDNWGNLRAQRGHVAPYSVDIFWELGNEPYTNFPVGGGYLRTSAGAQSYTTEFVTYATKLRSTGDSLGITLKIGCSLDDPEAGGPAIWEDDVFPGNEQHIDWVSVYHRYWGFARNPDENMWEAGAPVAKAVTPFPGGFTDSVFYAQQVREKIIEHIPTKQGIPILISETGFHPVYGIGIGNDLAYGLYRSSWFFQGAGNEQYTSVGHFVGVGENNRPHGYIGISDKDTGGNGGGNVELTPSYHILFLWKEMVGKLILDAVTNIKTYRETNLGRDFDIPYLSAFVVRSGSNVNLLVQNRGTRRISTTITFTNFVPKASATVKKVGGLGKLFEDTNSVNPNNVVVQNASITDASTSFKFTYEPLSLTLTILVST